MYRRVRRMSEAVAGGVFALLVLCCARPPAAMSPESAPDLPDAVTIMCFAGPNTRVGSGVVVGEQHVVTAAHVVSCPGKVFVGVGDTKQKEWHLATIQSADFLADVVRLKVPDTRLMVGSVETSPPPPPDSIICAMTAVPNFRKKCGLVRHINVGSFWHTAPVVPGNSGSGMFNSTGELVGIVSTWVQCNGESCGGTSASIWPIRSMARASP